MELNRKGVLFIFLSITVVSLLAMIYSGYISTKLDSHMETEILKIRNSQEFLESAKLFSEEGLRVSSYSAMKTMIDDIHETDSYYADMEELNKTFIELVYNGTINSVPKISMENKTLPDIMEEYLNITRQYYNKSIYLNISNISLDQKFPFSFTVLYELDIYFKNQDVMWNTSQQKDIEVDIFGLKDPLYFKTNHNRTFRLSPYLVEELNNPIFELLINKTWYMVTPVQTVNITGFREFGSMSFFGRMTDNPDIKSSTTLNLISIVNPNNITDLGGTPPTNYSYIDFMWGYEFPASHCSVLVQLENRTFDVKIDNLHAKSLFNLTDTEIAGC